MRHFEILETNDLVKVLAEYTGQYTKMLTEGGKEKDILNCKETIRSLIDEIELRKRSQAWSSAAVKNRRYIFKGLPTHLFFPEIVGKLPR